MQTDVIEGFRLSPQQKHLWSLQQGGRSLPYHARCAILIEGKLDTGALKTALQKTVDRHEILRTSFYCGPGMTVPLQSVCATVIPSITNYDLRGCDPAQQKTAIETLYREAGDLASDFANGPLLRLTLITLSRERHTLLVTLSALCVDAVSLNNLVRDLSRCYSAGQDSEELSDPPLQYADAAEWQNDLLESEETESGRKYWRDRNFSIASPHLPFEQRSSNSSTFAPHCVTSSISPDLAASIGALVRKYHTSLSVFFLACWETLISRLAGQEDFVIGLACDGRTYEGLQEALGLFEKTLPIPSHFNGKDRFEALLQRIDESVRDAIAWQEYFSWDQTSHAETNPGSPPPFLSIGFEFTEEPAKYATAGISFSIQKRDACSDRFALKLSCAQKGEALVTEFHYDSSSFRAEDIARLDRSFQTLLNSVTNHPDAEIDEFEIVSGSDLRQLLIEFNNTRTDYPNDKCVQQLFEQQVDRTPQGVAVVFEERHLTYAQLNAHANQLAHHLRSLGVGAEVPVAVCIERSLEMVVGILGILKAGGAYVPLDPGHPGERLAHMLEDVRAPIVLTQKRFADKLPGLALNVLCLDSAWSSIAVNFESNPAPIATEHDLAYVIYTSGSTGAPKGVMVEHGGLGNAINWITRTLELSVSDRCLLKTPITFDAAGREFFPTLISGGTLVIAEPDGHRDCRYLAEKIRSERISILHCVPSLLRLLLEEPAFHDTHALRAVMCGGEALAPEIVARFGERCTAQLYNVYGPTETIIDATYSLCDARDTHSTVPIGRPIPNARVYILDRLLRPLPIGVAGNLYIGGAGLARGYFGRPDLTAEKFIPDPFSADPGARLYQSGDLARYLPDGNIEFLGRIDHQVKIRGFRIELGEIEATLGRHPAVREAVALLREDGRGEQRLAAYVTAAKESRPASDDLRTFLKDKLPDYMIPAVFVLLDALPLTPNGKLDRRALPTPDGQRLALDAAFVACRTPTEELLAEIWSQVLAVERVGIHDNFFQLGGHSLLATQVVSRIRDAFQQEMPLRRLFEAPTVAALAETIDLGRGTYVPAPPIVPVPRDGELPLSFAQQRLWFLDRLEPGSSVYNFPAAVRLKGPLNAEALKQSLNEIVRRHEALRTTFAMVDGRPVQVVASCLTLTVPLVDLRALPGIEREAEVRRLATEEAQRPFDLVEGPLVRATVLRLGECEHVGLLTMHHIVADGWSTGILIRELAVLYDSYCSKRPSPLPELPIQYADFAHWQRHWLDGKVLETQLNYWRTQLLGAPPFLELPADHPRPTVQTFRGAQQSFLLPATVGDGLKALSRREGVTLFMTLLAAFQILLHRYTNQDDLIVGTPIANRNRSETEGLIGFFVNSLALRTDLSGNPEFLELLRRVREACLGAYAHQDLPFERLVGELHRTRDLSRNPVFQVMFVLQNASPQVVELPGMTLSPIEINSGTTHFDLTLHIADTDQGLVGTFAYNTDLFEAATITRMLGHYQDLVETIVAAPERRLADITRLTEAESRQILEVWNDTAVDIPNDRFIHQLFEAQVARTPAAIAIVLENEQLSYQELNCRSNQLANHLRALGVGPESAVGICLKHSLETVIALLAVLKAGAVYVPLDPAYPKERLAFMLEDANIRVLLTQEPLLARLPAIRATVVCLDSQWNSISQASPEDPACVTVPENLAYVIYTSGSTGRPKGVSVSHRSIAEHCLNVQRHYDLTCDDKVLQFASLSFDLSLEQILPTLIVGATLVMMSTDVWQTKDFHKKILAFGLTVLNISTGYWQELAREWAALTELVPPIEPRVLIVGGDTMSPEFLDLWHRTPMRSIRLINAYGPTETTITATAFDIIPPLCDHSTHQRIPIGRPLANRETYILNDCGNAVAVGIPGELYIGGNCLARGYLDRPDLTAEKFIPNPFTDQPGSRMYKTGDLARYLPDGNIEFLGRVDHQVKIRGFRIELGEIEAVLRQHPAVREVVVMALESPAGEQHLVAYIVPQSDASPTPGELRGFLTHLLPDYMMPAIFVPLDALPLMLNGKIDRNALPALERTQSGSGVGFVAPRNPLERELVVLWEEVLGIRPIGVTDNFFELGGHSLAAVRLFSLIEKRLGKTVPLATVFQGATVEHLANILDRNSKEAPPSSLVAIQPAGNRRPLFLIHPAGGHVFPYVHLAHYLGSDQPCYGLQARGLEEGQAPHTRIEDMATDYINAIRTVQPKGPYLLGGWSMGGVVAFDMARQLQAQGQRVDLLALLDARIPAADEEIADEDFEARLLVDFVRYFGLSLDPRDALARLPKHELLQRVLEHAKRAGLMPSDIEVSQAQPFIELCKADFRATRNYVLHRYPGRITLFKAGEELGGTSSDPTLGWNEWAAGGVDVQVVPGNHATMVYKPHVEVLANKLRARIDQLRAPDHGLTDQASSSITLMKDTK